jgi:hypothetical protein
VRIVKPAGQNNFVFAPAVVRKSYKIHGPGSSSNYEFFGIIGSMLINSIYVFRAERLTVGVSNISAQAELLSDASNLATCLLHLQSLPYRYDQYISLVREILPSVQSASAAPIDINRAEISIWSMDPALDRDDLKIKLPESGTGVGQILAMIYVCLQRDKKIFVIDEPNSFLHPAASRKLINVLRKYDHQYIISTHAPEIIAGTDPDRVHLVRWAGGSSGVETIGAKDIVPLRTVLGEVGIRLSDLFGPDSIIWVEGPTEEKCFPLLFEAAKIELPRGASIVALLHTGDFEAKRARGKVAFELYERLSKANALVPPAIAFVFDREGRSEQEIADLERRGTGPVKILPRKMYENYLIDPEAVAQVISAEAGEPIIAEQKVIEWLRQHGGDKKYYRQEWNGELTNEEWLKSVDSSKLFSDMFGELTDARYIYRKTTHSVAPCLSGCLTW